MAKHIERTTDEREPDAQHVIGLGDKSHDRFEESGQLPFGMPTPVSCTSILISGPLRGSRSECVLRLSVSEGIGQQIAEDAAEQHRITAHMGVRWNRSKIDAPSDSGIFASCRSRQNKGPGPTEDTSSPLARSAQKKVPQTIKLFGKLRDGPPTPVSSCACCGMSSTRERSSV